MTESLITGLLVLKYACLFLSLNPNIASEQSEVQKLALVQLKVLQGRNKLGTADLLQPLSWMQYLNQAA